MNQEMFRLPDPVDALAKYHIVFFDDGTKVRFQLQIIAIPIMVKSFGSKLKEIRTTVLWEFAGMQKPQESSKWRMK